MDSERTASLNYEAEYNRIRDEVEKAKYEICRLREKCEEYRRKADEAEIIKRTLYVVFGRGFDNER